MLMMEPPWCASICHSHDTAVRCASRGNLGQESFDETEHAFDVEIVRKVPLLLAAVEDGALVDVPARTSKLPRGCTRGGAPGAVEEHVDVLHLQHVNQQLCRQSTKCMQIHATLVTSLGCESCDLLRVEHVQFAHRDACHVRHMWVSRGRKHVPGDSVASCCSSSKLMSVAMTCAPSLAYACQV